MARAEVRLHQRAEDETSGHTVDPVDPPRGRAGPSLEAERDHARATTNGSFRNRTALRCVDRKQPVLRADRKPRTVGEPAVPGLGNYRQVPVAVVEPVPVKPTDHGLVHRADRVRR